MKKLTVLEIYILSCLGRGMENGYDLLRKGSLSLGASTPALRRLVNSGHVTRKGDETSSGRPRFAFKVTAKGSRELESGWRFYLEQGDGDLDLESVLRIVDIAAHSGASRADIARFLTGSANARVEIAKKLAFESAIQASRTKLEYRDLKVQIEAARVGAEAEALSRVVKSLKGKGTKVRDKKSTFVQESLLK